MQDTVKQIKHEKYNKTSSKQLKTAAAKTTKFCREETQEKHAHEFFLFEEQQ